MHELGIVTHVMKTIEDLAPENHIARVGSVTLEIGEVSGIVTDQFLDCWNYFRKKRPLFRDAELKIETVPAVTYCESCGRTYPTVRCGRICPHCGSSETYLLTGNRCVIKEIEAESGPSEAVTPPADAPPATR